MHKKYGIHVDTNMKQQTGLMWAYRLKASAHINMKYKQKYKQSTKPFNRNDVTCKSVHVNVADSQKAHNPKPC